MLFRNETNKTDFIHLYCRDVSGYVLDFRLELLERGRILLFIQDAGCKLLHLDG